MQCAEKLPPLYLRAIKKQCGLVGLGVLGKVSDAKSVLEFRALCGVFPIPIVGFLVLDSIGY
jgi:hypothetical protein